MVPYPMQYVVVKSKERKIKIFIKKGKRKIICYIYNCTTHKCYIYSN